MDNKIITLEELAQFCSGCDKYYFDSANREHIYHTNYCLGCEHIEAERIEYENSSDTV